MSVFVCKIGLGACICVQNTHVIAERKKTRFWSQRVIFPHLPIFHMHLVEGV